MIKKLKYNKSKKILKKIVSRNQYGGNEIALRNKLKIDIKDTLSKITDVINTIKEYYKIYNSYNTSYIKDLNKYTTKLTKYKKLLDTYDKSKLEQIESNIKDIDISIVNIEIKSSLATFKIDRHKTQTNNVIGTFTRRGAIKKRPSRPSKI
jgi:hypothetical protein